MRPIFYQLVIALLFSVSAAVAQAPFAISGKVVDDKGAAVSGANVFVSGTQLITTTDAEGKYAIVSLDAGSYRVSVQLMGYHPFDKEVLVQTQPVSLDITLKVKPIVLKTVKIGGDGAWAKNYELFKRHFLGIAPNSKECTIVNPEVISFGTKDKKLTAEADELLIIENKALGYRIRYMLKTFNCNPAAHTASYDGDPTFEPLPGSDIEKAKWATNRLAAYNGSLMHFLRAVYNNTVPEEGFVANQLYLVPSGLGRVLSADPRPVKFDTLVTVTDTAFVSAKFTSLYIKYDPKKAKAVVKDSVAKVFSMSPNGSILNLYLKEAIIDSRGNYADYRTFLLQGLWGRRGIGDQLPFEYQPAVIAN